MQLITVDCDKSSTANATIVLDGRNDVIAKIYQISNVNNFQI
jgi:hypothetical protein